MAEDGHYSRPRPLLSHILILLLTNFNREYSRYVMMFFFQFTIMDLQYENLVEDNHICIFS